ncbi:hypothetical protein ACNHYB_06315 [Isoptericola jiangsuensis]|uniref:hypothetical protein n=1 Tax=Isoptericola jiangsuensis TaxID=548579 RepID=UPI003AAC44E6
MVAVDETTPRYSPDRSPDFWTELARVMEDVLVRAANGDVAAIPRGIAHLPSGDGFGVMAAVDAGDGWPVVGVKVVMLPASPRVGAPSHPGSVLLFDAKDGALLARFDADLLTGLRTAATTATVTRRVRPDATSFVVIGSGTQARAHVQALSAHYPSADFVLWGRSEQSAQRLAHVLRADGIRVTAERDLAGALASADVVTSVTSAREPFLGARLLGPDVHVNAVGASIAGLCEWRRDVFDVAQLLLCDDTGECARQSAEVPADCLSRASDVGWLLRRGSLVPMESGVSVYKSVGVAALDVAAAKYLTDLGGNDC